MLLSCVPAGISRKDCWSESGDEKRASKTSLLSTWCAKGQTKRTLSRNHKQINKKASKQATELIHNPIRIKTAFALVIAHHLNAPSFCLASFLTRSWLCIDLTSLKIATTLALVVTKTGPRPPYSQPRRTLPVSLAGPWEKSIAVLFLLCPQWYLWMKKRKLSYHMQATTTAELVSKQAPRMWSFSTNNKAFCSLSRCTLSTCVTWRRTEVASTCCCANSKLSCRSVPRKIAGATTTTRPWKMWYKSGCVPNLGPYSGRRRWTFFASTATNVVYT